MTVKEQKKWFIDGEGVYTFCSFLNFIHYSTENWALILPLTRICKTGTYHKGLHVCHMGNFFSLMDRLCNLEEFFLIIILFTMWQKNFKVFNYVLVHMMCYQQVSKSSNSPTPVLIYAKIAHSSKRDLTSKVWAHSDIL